MSMNEAPGRDEHTGGKSNNIVEATNLDDQDIGQQGQRDSDCIFSRGVWLYRDAGWRGVLPLPPGEKYPPPTGFTGYDGEWPTDSEIETWIANRAADSNLGLRLFYGFIGLDVDDYADKTGGATLAEGERRWGALPPTYRSTARIDDPVSGIRVFKVPLGVLFRGDLKFVLDGGRKVGHLDIIQPHHRLIVGWPSIHPKTGRAYQWFAPDGTLMLDAVVPRVEDIPELPERWVEGLSRDAVREEFFDNSAPNRTRAQLQRVNEELYQELIGLRDNGAPVPLVQVRLDKALFELEDGTGSRYDTTRDHVAALMRFHALGRAGVPRALDELFRAYVMQVSDTRTPAVAESEFLRFTEGAAALVAGSMPHQDQANAARVQANSDNTSQGHEQADALSWTPVDLTGLLAGECEPLLPRLFQRSDGNCLLYPGMVHSIHGEPESGKSLIVQAESVNLLNKNEDVLYIDFDSDDRSVVDRLREFGANPDSIAAHFHYIQPEVKPESFDEQRAWEEMLSGKYALAVIDGVTDALGVFGCSTNDNDDVARWIREVPKLIASRTGAAVVLIDHVVKEPANRNRFAIGGQAKMAGLTGAAYTVDVIEPLGRGLRGEVVLRVAKDRPGEVRRHCVSFKKKDRTQEAARIVVDSTVEPPTVTIAAPVPCGNTDPGGPNGFRPTSLMERASKVIEQQPGQLTKNGVALSTGGNKQATLRAIDLLRDEEYVKTSRGRSGHDVYESVKPYREARDPLSDRYVNLGNGYHSQ